MASPCRMPASEGRIVRFSGAPDFQCLGFDYREIPPCLQFRLCRWFGPPLLGRVGEFLSGVASVQEARREKCHPFRCSERIEFLGGLEGRFPGVEVRCHLGKRGFRLLGRFRIAPMVSRSRVYNGLPPRRGAE